MLKVKKKLLRDIELQQWHDTPLTIVNDTLYTGMIYMGTPQVPMNMTFDLGFTAIVAMSPQACVAFGCNNETVYNVSDSTSAKLDQGTTHITVRLK